MNEILVESLLGTIRVQGDADAVAGIWFAGQKYEPEPVRATREPRGALAQARDWLHAYLECAPLPASPKLLGRGTEFQRSVWEGLDAIPMARTRRYGELALQIGHANAARAVGAAVGRNPWSILRPCHRVTGADGRLTGYAGGLGRKRALLALEAGQDMPWQAVTLSYTAQYQDPISVVRGELVRWRARTDDGEFPGWKWAETATGRAGWVPRAWFSPGEQESKALRSYSAVELNVQSGQRVLELDRFGGWLLVRLEQGAIGWIPESCLEHVSKSGNAA